MPALRYDGVLPAFLADFELSETNPAALGRGGPARAASHVFLCDQMELTTRVVNQGVLPKR